VPTSAIYAELGLLEDKIEAAIKADQAENAEPEEEKEVTPDG
jgi:hypothetical protein